MEVNLYHPSVDIKRSNSLLFPGTIINIADLNLEKKRFLFATQLMYNLEIPNAVAWISVQCFLWKVLSRSSLMRALIVLIFHQMSVN